MLMLLYAQKAAKLTLSQSQENPWEVSFPSVVNILEKRGCGEILHGEIYNNTVFISLTPGYDRQLHTLPTNLLDSFVSFSFNYISATTNAVTS